MKIFRKDQIQKIEKLSVEEQNISFLDLMECAAIEATTEIISKIDRDRKVYIFCGNGNNGGDGFAIARLLSGFSFEVKVFADLSNEKLSENAKLNFDRIKDLEEIQLKDFDDLDNYKISEEDIIIDALFGIGLNRPITGKLRLLIEKLNVFQAKKIAIDIPSGLYTDVFTPENHTVFKADYTFSFQFWKKAFLYPETGKFCGEISILNIDLSQKYIEETDSSDFIIDDAFIKQYYKPRSAFGHKGTFGKVAIIAGSYGKIGAAVLATRAALHSGSGLTFCVAPDCGNLILQTLAPEAMFIKSGEEKLEFLEIPDDAICGIGPGLGTDLITQKIVLKFLEDQNKPIVIDADALNIISLNKSKPKFFPKNSVITPHPKEFDRLFGKTENSFDRTELGKRMAKKLKIAIVLKDHHTQIILPTGKVYYNITGNSGMAKGGSGDVLTGVITALLAQNYASAEAAILGVWLHGKAGDVAAQKFSKEAMLPGDLINCLGEVFTELSAF